MAASLQSITLPTTTSSTTEDNDTSIKGWDHSIITDDELLISPTTTTNNNNNVNITNCNLITYDVIALNNILFDTTSSTTNSEQDESTTNNELCSLSNNITTIASTSTNNTDSNSKIVAVITKNSKDGRDGYYEINLCNGNGLILATRAIGSSSSAAGDEEGEEFIPQLYFVPNNHSTSDSNTSSEEEESNTLLVICPPSTQASNVIIITNLYASKLNSTDSNEVKEGLSCISMDMLPLPSLADAESEDDGATSSKRGVVKWMQGINVNSSTIRFFIQYTNQSNSNSGSESGGMAVADYNIVTKKIELVLDSLNENIAEQLGDNVISGDNESGGEREIVGLGIDSYNTQQSLLVVAFSGLADDFSKNVAKSPSTILWIDIRTLQIRAQYILPLGSSLLACTPVQSIDGSKYVAAAIASTSQEDGKVEIHVIQSLLTSLDDDIQVRDDSSMILFTIATQDTINNNCDIVNLCSPPGSDDQRPYSFRYMYKTTSNSGEEKTKCFEFVPNEQVQLGNIQDMLQVEFDHDGALNVLNDMLSKPSATTSSDSTNNNSSKVYIPITKSTIALHQFQHLLSIPDTSSNETNLNFDEIKECLKQMAKYIIISSGTDDEDSNKNVETMCAACQFLMNWPMNQNSGSSEDDVVAKVSIHQVVTALATMSSSLNDIIQVVGASSTSSTLLIEQRIKINDKCNTLETISSILPSLAEQQGIPIDDPFLHIESIISLLFALIQCGAFKLVSCLIKHVNKSTTSSMNSTLTTDAIASSTMHIPKSIHPNHYISWLCEDTVIPSLYIGHPMLKLICSWVCNAANHYDDSDSLNIDSSIVLLKSVSKAIARLTVETMNKNYDYPSQYLDANSNDEGAADGNSNNDETLNTSSSTSTTRRSNSRPTVLNIGMISGMKRKDGRMMSAQRVTSSANRVNTTAINNTSLMDFSFFNNNPSPNSVTEQASFVNDDDDEDEDESIEYDCVEIKLNNAIRLKKARSLGLDKQVLTLANYSSMGEQYIVKELVKMALSKQSSSTEGEDEDLIDKIRTYASEVDANFDEAVQQYATELCSDNNHTTDVPQAIQQSQVLSQWVTDPSVKCTIVLQMLRRARVSVDCPPDLSSIAKDAISIAVNEKMKSQLVEDLKLLVIDTLVRKYCGNGAQDYFKVVEPSHCIKLVQHVIRHIDVPTVLEDVLVLTEAFTHVSKIDTCVSLLQRTMVAAQPKGSSSYRSEQCASFMREIYSNDAILAERVGERVVAFCAGILEDCKKMLLQGNFPEEAKSQAKVASSTSCSILAVMQDQVIQGERHSNISKLLKEFQIISKMQSGCGIYLTIEELRNPSSCASVVSALLQPSVDLLRARSNSLNMEEDSSVHNELIPLVATARQWCDILCCTRSQQTNQIWSRAISNVASEVAKLSTNHGSLLLLAVSGLLDERNERSSFHAIMSVALTLCAKAFSEVKFISQDETDFSMAILGMRSMARASQLLNEHILLYSPPSMLSASLSLNCLMRLVCDVSVRSDMGIGTKLENYIQMLKTTSRKTRQHFNITHMKKSLVNNMLADKRLPPAPNLHPTWYIGDGILLQPLDALSLSMAYCKKMLEIESSTRSSKSHQPLMEKNDIMRSLESRGAHSTSLRVLMLSTATTMSQSSNPTMFANAENMLKNNVSVLAERSLGGNESGLTSGNIDALMSVAFLLHLPKEMAFKIYQAALPSAIGKRDFPRTLTLASVGTYCGVGTFPSGEKFPWSKQQRFIEQCDELSCNATWWSILSEHRVPFDPSVFSQSSAEQILNGYCKQLVQHATKKLGSRSTLTLARRFMKDYNLNKHIPTSAMIEYLLSSPVVDATDNTSNPDIRWDLSQTETAVKEYLILLPTLNQNLVLRRCIMNLEKDDSCSKDYDRHAMVLRLYLECLDKLSSVMKKSDSRAKAHEEEMGRIERRQEAIAIISSAFENYDLEKKPEYNKLFQPLPPDPSKLSKDVTKSNVLGADAEETVFDPLAPLEAVLEDENGSNSIVAALAPLCSLLLLPSGYLHARSLIVRFRKLKTSGSLLPSFDISVIPVIKKLKTPRDKADFCWWCSLQYNAGSVDQLNCLDIAHENSTLASEQAEYSKDPEEERVALERVKRVDASRAGLSDKILVDEVLKRHESTPKSIKKLYKSIIDKVQQQAVLSENYSPEHLVQALLLEGSLTVAGASLNNTDGFATHHFRLLALMVHDACKSLSNRYSHVNVGSICRLLTRRFLVHGDDGSDEINIEGENDNIGVKKNESDLSTVNEEEDEQTSEFIMDMSLMSSGNQTWSNDARRVSGGITSSTHTHESSALTPSSPRETSDDQCGRVSLRVAFMICFAEDYHCRPDSPPSSEKKRSVKRRSSASKIREGDLALQHARELLGIAFARQGSTVASTYGFLFGDESSAYDTSILSTVPEDDMKEDNHSKSKALSFAMRHRALRVATILCPQDIIKRVIVEEMYADNDFGDDHLNKCSFASFVAKEIEAMGLPLPHSGLIELSTMHFPSYARTLWRNHGPSMTSPPLSGRLHLLLLELCINHHESVDWELFMLLFSELERLELPRSLLLACECAVESRAVSLAASQERIDMLQVVESATKKIVGLIVSEVETHFGADMDVNLFDYMSTLHRVVSVINTDGMHEDPTYFVDAFSKLSERCLEKGQEEAADIFTNASIRVTSYLTDSEVFRQAKSFAAANRRDADDEEDVASRTPFLDSVCSEAMQAFESSFH